MLFDTSKGNQLNHTRNLIDFDELKDLADLDKNSDGFKFIERKISEKRKSAIGFEMH